MVVRVPGEPSGSAFPFARLWHNGVATIVSGLAAFDASDRSRRNAHAASVELATARAERRRVDAFLADHASARARSAEHA
ncbi:MAG: hypothetical protein ACRD0P_38070 [Stackebrandtia sp.]